MDKRYVIISRNFIPTAEINIQVTDLGINVAMGLDDFLQALAKEMGNPAMLLTNQALNKRLVTAATAICESMKAETQKVM